MSGKRRFDYDRAIDQATRLFWARGYSRTSLCDLLNVMGIGEGSFYNAFKSKRYLYLECLKHYNETVTARRWRALMAASGVRQGIRRYFVVVLDDLDDPRTPNVCLMAGSLSGDVLSDRALSQYVVGQMRAMERALVRRLELARRGGELPRTFDARVAAQVIVTFLQGFFRVARVLNSRAQLERQIDAVLTGVGL